MRAIKRAIAEKSTLDILYLNSSDEKFRRTVVPRRVGPMEYFGKTFTGLAAYCLHRREDRVFRLDRILEMTPTPSGARMFPTELPL
jgi:predicted DNA-binding transcriptional regulator YafY